MNNFFRLSLAAFLTIAAPSYAANTAKQTPGALNSGSYTSCGFAAGDINSLANAAGIVATSATLDNSSNLDTLMQISGTITMGGTTSASGAFLKFYIVPQNQDGTTYGDQITTIPSSNYEVATVGIKGTVGSGTAITWTTSYFFIPTRGVFKVAIYNGTGAAFNASAAATINCRTTNINLNG